MRAAGRPTGFYCKSRPVLFSPKANMAYVKTPKGASLAIQDLFQRQFPDYRWADAHEELPSDTLVFTFVREPLKRAMSAYAEIDVAYALRASPEAKSAMRTAFDKVNRKSGARETPRVLAFLDDLMDHRFGGDDREHWMPTHAYSQLNFMCNHRIDFIGQLENQAADWEAIQKLGRIPPSQRTPFPHAHDSSVLKTNATNTSVAVCNRACQLKAADQHAPMTPPLLQRLCDVFASDFVCLGYPMPSACQRPPEWDDAAAPPAAAHPLNGTAPLTSSGSGGIGGIRLPSYAPPAPVYLMAQLGAASALHLLHEEPAYRNSLFLVPCAAENRSTLYRLKRAENASFAPSASSDARLLRDFDRFGWYWRNGVGGGSGTSSSSKSAVADLPPRAPLAVGLPVRSISGHTFAEATAEARLGVERALSEAQQLLLLHRYDRVVVVGRELPSDSGAKDAFTRYAVDAISRRLIDPLVTASAPVRPTAGAWAALRGTNGSAAPHKHFLPGRSRHRV